MNSTLNRPTILSDEDRIDWIRLWQTTRIGPVSFRVLLRQHGTATNAIRVVSERYGDTINTPSRSAVQREIDALQKMGGHLVFLGQTDYPTLLSHTDDAPPVLSVVGRKELLIEPMIAVVGTRNASLHGLRMARTIVGDLTNARSLNARPFVIVSGMAIGIDQEAHQAALSHGTVGVLAHGIDIEYPRGSSKLFAQMREQGALISENPLRTPPSARSFPKRNRIIAGCAVGTLVVEATQRSGSIITAKMAATYGREVMAVPGSPLDERSGGVNELLRDGAALITSARDVLAVLEQSPGLFSESLRGLKKGLIADNLMELTQASILQSAHKNDASITEQDLLALNAKILSLLGASPVAIDHLVEELQREPSVVLSCLVDLELRGEVQLIAGALVQRTYNSPSS